MSSTSPVSTLTSPGLSANLCLRNPQLRPRRHSRLVLHLLISVTLPARKARLTDELFQRDVAVPSLTVKEAVLVRRILDVEWIVLRSALN